MADPVQMLVTLRPGPVLHVWRDGVEVAAVPLSIPAALSLVAQLVAALREAQCQ